MAEVLEYYIQALRGVNLAAFLRRIDYPVLIEAVHRDETESAITREGFRTAFMVQPPLVNETRDPTTTREVLVVKKRENSLFSGHIGVGRTSNLDISIPRPGISKFHAYFSIGPDGDYRLTDKDSRNGTFVAGEKIPAGVPVSVRDGSEVSFAAHVFRFAMPRTFYEIINSSAT